MIKMEYAKFMLKFENKLLLFLILYCIVIAFVAFQLFRSKQFISLHSLTKIFRFTGIKTLYNTS